MNKTYLPMPVSSVENYKTIRMQKIYDYVDKNYTRPFPIKEVADNVALSVPSFCNFFKEQTGYTFITYLQIYKVDKVCKMLEYTEMEISDIILKCGFNSISFFNMLFRRYKGKTPSEYRKYLKIKQTLND